MNMATKQKFLNAYKSTDLESVVLSATPHKRISLLYDGAIRHVKLAQLSLARKDIPAKAMHTGKAMDIISGLRATLDHERGGELSHQLDALYDFLVRHLLEASTENSEEKYATVQDILTTLKEGWDGMPEEYKSIDDTKLQQMKANA